EHGKRHGKLSEQSSQKKVGKSSPLILTKLAAPGSVSCYLGQPSTRRDPVNPRPHHARRDTTNTVCRASISLKNHVPAALGAIGFFWLEMQSGSSENGGARILEGYARHHFRPEHAMSVKYLFIDMNSYFASVEQQLRPNLRGVPVAVAAVDAETTSCIAASYEAKRFGVRTGTRVSEA